MSDLPEPTGSPLTIEGLDAAVDILLKADLEPEVTAVPQQWLDRARIRSVITGRPIETEVIGLAVEAMARPSHDDVIGFRPR